MSIPTIFSYLFLSPKAILIAAAVIPAAVLMIFVYRKDRIEKEPDWLLLQLVLFGALATLPAVLAESFGSGVLSAAFGDRGDTQAYDFWMFFVVVGLSEELFKYLAMRWRTWRSPHFNCRFDGVVYAVFVSLGFALAENIGYVLLYGFGAAVARAITAVPGHASFGVFMGACYGFARRAANSGAYGASRFWRWLAVLLPATIHGCYDYIAVGADGGVTESFLVFVAVVFLAALVLLRNLSRTDRFLPRNGENYPY